MKRALSALAVALACTTLLAAQHAGSSGTTGMPPTAGSTLVDVAGRAVGQAMFQQTPHGVLVRLELKNATPGVHGLHVHSVGKCDGPSFASAGDHFSPSHHGHGFVNPSGPHEGDLPNIHVPISTELSVEYLMPDVTLDPGPRSLLDADGSALVMHAGKDDYMSNPAGMAGDRLACGAIVSSSSSAH